MGKWRSALETVALNNAFWKNKRVFITGHTGFKGSWLVLWLKHLGAQVTGFSLDPVNHPNLFSLACVHEEIDSYIGDVCDLEILKSMLKKSNPEIIFHLAAQSLVRESYNKPIETYATNVMGTANLLEAVRYCDSVRTIICITTDKVYQNQEWIWPYRETDPLGGFDPYSSSKAASELVINTYRAAFLNSNIALASARAGNVIGGGDWSLERLIPDAVRAWSSGQVLEVRRPEAIRPWQHVLDCLHAYLVLAEKIWAEPQLADAYNFGPAATESTSVEEVIKRAMRIFDPMVKTHFHSVEAGPHEAGQLRLDVSRAQNVLGVQSQWSLEQAIEKTFNWYKAQLLGEDAAQLCLQDIRAYEYQE